MIIFTHIPRTAGTSMKLVIEKNVPKDEILQVYGNRIPIARKYVAAQNLNNIKVIRGHIGFGVLPGKQDYIALLRHPMTRLASLYKYVVNDHGHFANKEVRSMSFHDFIFSGVTAETDNGMVRQLCGIEDYQQVPYAEYKVPFGQCGPEQLERALKNLDEHYTIVGTQEDFAGFLRACAARFDWTLPSPLPRVNRSTAMSVPDPTGRTVQQAMTLNMYDLILWDYVRRRTSQ